MELLQQLRPNVFRPLAAPAFIAPTATPAAPATWSAPHRTISIFGLLLNSLYLIASPDFVELGRVPLRVKLLVVHVAKL